MSDFKCPLCHREMSSLKERKLREEMARRGKIMSQKRIEHLKKAREAMKKKRQANVTE